MVLSTQTCSDLIGRLRFRLQSPQNLMSGDQTGELLYDPVPGL